MQIDKVMASRNILSETKLLNSSADEYMNDAQLDFFRQRLMAMRAEIIERFANTSYMLKEAEPSSDPVDRATQEEEQAIELRSRDRDRKLLKKIEAALVRIENKTYGFCEDTQEPIGIRRLLARPIATLGVDAQERRERLEKVRAG